MIVMAFVSVKAIGQTQLGLEGAQFAAVSVSNADSTSAWYSNVFGMKLVKSIDTPEGDVHIRILSSNDLTLEIIASRQSKSIVDCSLKPDEGYLLKGIFKFGFYVKDIVTAEKFLKDKKVKFEYNLFEDEDMKIKSFIIADLNGTLIQFIQRI
jgi:catechol 2,3-dioxygenase-like lactoylglutathione lyase family enzyme